MINKNNYTYNANATTMQMELLIKTNIYLSNCCLCCNWRRREMDLCIHRKRFASSFDTQIYYYYFEFKFNLETQDAFTKTYYYMSCILANETQN